MAKKFFVIGVDPANGHKYTEVVNNIDEAKFVKDRLNDTGIIEVYITKEVDIEAEEKRYYEDIATSEMVAFHAQAQSLRQLLRIL